MSNLRHRLSWTVVSVLVVLAGLTTRDRAATLLGAQSGAATTAAMPVDPAIGTATLPNGIKYYVRANKTPAKRAELRLVVRAGSVLEDDDQQGLAHFVEHMAFNGTQHFPKNEIIAFIESLGMRFGADLNAGTSFDETTYILTVPTDDPAVLDRALLVMEDWAHNVTFDPAEVDRERGVVIEEWRSRLGAGARLTDKLFPIILGGSRYADRLPIGKTEILQTAKPERLKKFYTDWYRPDLMAVVVVGDFDRPAVEGMVKSHFSEIPAATSPKPRPVFDLPDHAGTSYALVSDKEMTATTVEVDHMLPAQPDGTLAAYRQKIVDQLFGTMVNARLGELARKPDPPFVGAGTGRSRFIVRTKDDAVISAQVKDDGVERGLDAMFVELARVRKYGFTPTEFDRQKQNMLRASELGVAQGANRTSASRAAEYIRNFLVDESLPTAADELALHQRFLADISLADVNAIAKSWYRDDNRVVIVEAPEKAGVTLPKDTALAAVMNAALARDVQPYVDSAAGATLLDAPPAPGAVTKTSTTTAGLTEWELANGVQVVLKPTAFKQDEIIFRATRAGGTSLAADADYIPANAAVSVVTAGGVGKLNATDLGKVMTGKVAAAAPFISETSEGVAGSASRKDLETMFQLIYLRFTQPRADAAAFTNRVTQMKTVLANQTASPAFAFQDALQKAMFQDNPRRRLLTADQVDQFNLDASLAFYKARFSDAAGFRFVFAGSFDPQELKPLVEKYLGSLPSAHRGETFKDLGIHVTPGVIDRRVQKGVDPKSQAVIVFSGPMVYDQTQRVAIRAAAEVLQMRLTEVIREELGGTYGVNVSATYSKIPRPEYTVQISWGCDPARTDGLIKRVLDEIALLQTNGPVAKQVTDEREALLREFETSSQDNRFLVDQLSARYQNGEDPDGLWQVTDFYKKLDAAMVQQAARTYLNASNRITVTLFPEK